MLPPEVLTETPVSLIIMRLSVDFFFFLFKLPSNCRENYPLQGQNLREVIPWPRMGGQTLLVCVLPSRLSAKLGGSAASAQATPERPSLKPTSQGQFAMGHIWTASCVFRFTSGTRAVCGMGNMCLETFGSAGGLDHL